MSKLSLGRMKVTHCTECVFSCFLKCSFEHFVRVKPLRPNGRTSGGGVKKCMTCCIDQGQSTDMS